MPDVSDIATLPEIHHSSELFIGGSWVSPQDPSATADVVSPFDGQVIRTLPRPSVADADLAVAAAAGAFEDWNALPFAERHAAVSRFCAALDSRLDDIVKIWALEAAMPVKVGGELSSAASELWARALEESQKAAWVEVRETDMGAIEVRHEGLGATVAIVAFNGPHVQFALAVIPGLLAGNTFIIKLPPECRMLGYLFAEAAEEAGFPAGVLSVLAGDADVSRHLVEHRDVAAIHFTGGTEVGRAVMHSAADRVANVVLELGGKSASIVAADADLDDAVAQLVDCLAMYSGQICVTMSRILVAREIHDEFVERLAEGVRGLVVGDPLDPATTWGPLISDAYRERAEGFIQRAVSEGAKIVHGGARPDEFDGGFFLDLTLLTDVRRDMEVAQKEIFGPVFSIIPFDDLDEAVDIANDSEYGLSGSIFTTDLERGREVARAIQTGVFIINGTFPCLAAPFGGMKQSGFGREGGPEGLFQLTSLRSITLPAG